MVFFRNILLYFDEAERKKLVQKAAEHVKKKGYLFLGSPETYWGHNIPELSPLPYSVFEVKHRRKTLREE